LEDSRNKDIATSFLKGLGVIEAFDHENPEMTLTEVAKKVNITRSAARRFLLSLESVGYATQNGKYFSLTPKIINLGYSYFSSLFWTDIANKHVRIAVNKSNLSCAISILDGKHITCIMRVHSSKILKVV
jgi:IclR family pca regulon transcriptional regulator